MTSVTPSTTDSIEDKFANILGPTDPALDRKVREKLVVARIGLLLKQPFFGNMATRLVLVNADEWCMTAATDGRHFYYNTRFIEMLSGPKEIEFLFGHEVLHCVYDHFGRRGKRNPKLWNIANDYCVNADLKKHKVGEFITSVDCLYDPKYIDWASEAVYDDLYENAEKIDIESLIEQLLDEHLEDSDSQGAGGEESDDNSETKGNGRPKVSPKDREEIREELKQAMIAAANSCDNAGSIPAGVRRMIKEITEPQMNWFEMLSMQLQSLIKNDFTFNRMNRKSWHLDARLPGMNYGEEIDIAIGMDMSGSILDSQGRDFLSEVKGIMEAFDGYRIHIFSFDTKIYNPENYTSDNLKDITEYELAGGGGTDFDCIFKYLKNNNIEPNKLVVFTDGYPWGSWGDPNYCDTLWIIHGDKDPNPPFGTFALYEQAA